jgi:hypothetical protein
MQILRQLDGLAASAYHEFGDALDYIWKSPRLIESETKLEAKKLDAYFPSSRKKEKGSVLGLLREARWILENNKLTGVFPYLMATGNLFASTSLFETYCLMLCKQIEKRTQASLDGSKGMGISRLFNFMSASGIKVERVSLRQQIDAALTIRNCLFHASGLLVWSREEDKLRKIVAGRTYLPADIRANYKKLKKPFDEVAITKGPLGERLYIKNHYAFLATAFLRDHFCELYNEFRSIYPDAIASDPSVRLIDR